CYLHVACITLHTTPRSLNGVVAFLLAVSALRVASVEGALNGQIRTWRGVCGPGIHNWMASPVAGCWDAQLPGRPAARGYFAGGVLIEPDRPPAASLFIGRRPYGLT